MTRYNDYSIRGEKQSNDEIGILTDGFNLMIEHMQKQNIILHEHSIDLEKQILGRTSDLKDSIEQLQIERDLSEKANKAKSDFLSSMSHELRTPLNAILGFSQLLLLNDEFSEDDHQSILEIQNAGDHLLNLINNILDLAKVENERFELVFDSISVKDIFSECYSLSIPIARKYNIKLTFNDKQTNNIFVSTDHTVFIQILLNLVSNAIKYNRENGEVIVQCENNNDGYIKFIVRDTGFGINKDNLKLLFMPFNRLGAECGSIEGTGIGLVITKNLVEKLGGEIGVESRLDFGSDFWFTMPTSHKLIVHDNKFKPEIINDIKKTGSQHTLLYIEDNITNLNLMEKIIKKHPYLHFIHESTGNAGLKMAFEYLPSLILLDINLPDIDGYEVLNRLKSSSKTKNIPVIAISAKAMQADLERASHAGFEAYITKPINVSSLFESIDAALLNLSKKMN